MPQNTPLNLMEHDRYRDAWNYLQELRERQTRLRNDYESLRSNLQAAEREDPYEAEAEALLHGTEVQTAVSIAQVRTQIEQNRHDSEVLRRAIERQERIVKGVAYDVSTEICNAVYPAYRKQVEKSAKALDELRAAQLACREIFDQLEDGGVVIDERLKMPYLDLAQAADRDGVRHDSAHLWRKRCEEFGLLEPAS